MANTMTLNSVSIHVIIYEKKDDSKVPVFVTIQPIKAGEELLCKYGDNYVRLYKVGQKAKKPAWL